MHESIWLHRIFRKVSMFLNPQVSEVVRDQMYKIRNGPIQRLRAAYPVGYLFDGDERGRGDRSLCKRFKPEDGAKSVRLTYFAVSNKLHSELLYLTLLKLRGYSTKTSMFSAEYFRPLMKRKTNWSFLQLRTAIKTIIFVIVQYPKKCSTKNFASPSKKIWTNLICSENARINQSSSGILLLSLNCTSLARILETTEKINWYLSQQYSTEYGRFLMVNPSITNDHQIDICCEFKGFTEVFTNVEKIRIYRKLSDSRRIFSEARKSALFS